MLLRHSNLNAGRHCHAIQSRRSFYEGDGGFLFYKALASPCQDNGCAIHALQFRDRNVLIEFCVVDLGVRRDATYAAGQYLKRRIISVSVSGPIEHHGAMIVVEDRLRRILPEDLVDDFQAITALLILLSA